MTCMHQPFRISLSMAAIKSTAHTAAASNEKTPSLSAINLKRGGGEGGHTPSIPNIFSSDSVQNGGDGQAGVMRNGTGRGIVRSTTPPYSPQGRSQYRSLPSSSAATPMQVSTGTPAHISSAIGVDFSGRKRDPEQLGRGKVGERGRREEGGEVDGDVGVEKMLGVNADNIMGPIVDVYLHHPSWCVPLFFFEKAACMGKRERVFFCLCLFLSLCLYFCLCVNMHVFMFTCVSMKSTYAALRNCQHNTHTYTGGQPTQRVRRHCIK